MSVEKYQLYVKAHHTRKEIEIDKLKIKHLKKNSEKVRNNNTNLNKRVIELEEKLHYNQKTTNNFETKLISATTKVKELKSKVVEVEKFH